MTSAQAPELPDPGALDTVEEAVHLLRLAPARILICYYLGSVPWMLGLLSFWAEMSWSATAADYVTAAALGLAGLFVWMKVWQAVFACRLRDHLAGHAAAPWTLARIGRLVMLHTVLHPWGLVLLPVALLVLLPLGWGYAFFQNVTVLGDGTDASLTMLTKRAMQQAKLWPRHNHLLLGVVGMFGLFVSLNVAIALFVLPQLLKMVLGIETVFTQHPLGMINSTFVATVCGLTYLCVDPLVKAAYVLRCFYGEALKSGEDLKGELRHLQPARSLVVLVVFLLGAVALSPVSWARANSSPSAEAFAQELDTAIDDVLQQRAYRWRLPPTREASDAPKGFSAGLVWILTTGRDILSEWVDKIVKKVIDWMQALLPRSRNSGDAHRVISWAYALLWGCLALIVCLLAALGWRLWRDHRRQLVIAGYTPMAATPDLTDDRVTADAMPTQSWWRMAQSLLEQGDLRLAIRALYLASLACLAERNLVTIAAYKSHRDYERELQRRAHAQPELLTTFAQNTATFERTWYGPHAVDSDTVQQCMAAYQEMQAYAEE